jgi:hypothetical protein
MSRPKEAHHLELSRMIVGAVVTWHTLKRSARCYRPVSLSSMFRYYLSHSATYRGKLHQYTGQRPKLSRCRSSQIQKRGYSCSKERPSSTIFALLLHPKSNTAIIVRVASYLGCQIASILVRTAVRYLADVSAVQYPVSSTTRELRESLDSSVRHPCVSLLDPTTNLD